MVMLNSGSRHKRNLVGGSSFSDQYEAELVDYENPSIMKL
jgi:hypothetical protein